MTELGWVPSAHELQRQRFRRRVRFRRSLIATLATFVVLFVAVAVITGSPGWPSVRSTFLSWSDDKAAFPQIGRAFWINVKMFLIAEVLILVLGTVVAVTRQSRSPWLAPARIVAIIYTDLLRGIPTLLVVYLFALGVPALRLTGVTNSLFGLTLVALVLSYGAYVAEVIRAGILSIHPSQISSAEALALSSSQTMRFVVLPQAFRRVVPPLLNDFVSLQKDTALASTVGVFEALFAAQDYGNYHFNFSPLLVAAGFFVLLTIPMARFTDWLAMRATRREFGR